MRCILVSSVLVTALIGCASDNTSTGPSNDRLVATLAATTGGSIAGSADVLWTTGSEQFTATMMITGDVPGSVRPWHVHFGTCATGGDVVGPAGSYNPFTVAADGTAQVSATVEFELAASAPYHVNVHESPTSSQIIIACGNLALASGGGSDDNGGGDDGGGRY